MKRFVMLLGLCMLLAGCGNQMQSVEEPSPVPSAEQAVWGVQMESQEESAPSFKPTATPTPTLTPTPTPTPTPLPVSLTETVAVGPPVVADGVTLGSIAIGGYAYVKASDFAAVYPWLTVTRDENGAALTAYDGTLVPLLFVETDGSAALPESGDVGVHFAGQQQEDWLPLRQIAEAVGLYILWDSETDTVYVTHMPDTNEIPQGRTVPVWMYHEVGNDIWGIESLFVSPDNMREQLQYLQDNGYQPIFFSDLTHLEDYDKPVLLTFDDGYIGMYTELFPLLKEFQMKATVFVITGSLGTEHYITAEQAKEMSDSGLVSIQSHTVNHPTLAELSAEAQEEELRQSQLDIARITGRIPYVLSYPTGSHNDTTIELGKQYYKFGVKMNGGKWTIDNNYFSITRLYAARTTDIGTYGSNMR